MRNVSKIPATSKNSPPKEKSSTLPLDDIEKELMAEASVMDQMSSSDSSSDSKSSSSSSEDSSSSDSEGEAGKAPLPPPLPFPQPQNALPAVDIINHRPQDNEGQFMNTLRSDLQLSDSGSDSD
ncbi:ELL-associated factor 2 isoform X2 [Latimeria chalumnae]